MRIPNVFAAIALALAGGLGYGQAAPNSPKQLPDVSQLVGVWKADVNNLPVFRLVITDEGGGISGAILFYLLKREDPNHPFTTATPGLPAPILNPTFDGKTLTFKVSHRQAHPPRTLNDPPVSYTLTPLAANQARFISMSDGNTITVTRSDY